MPQPCDAHARDGGAEHRRVAHSGVDACQRNQTRCIDEIDFVDADDRPNASRFRGHEQPVEESWFEVGHGRASDDHHLVDVGDDHMTTAAASPAERVAAQLNRLDHADAGIVADPHPVAGGHRMPLLRREHAQQAASGAANEPSVSGTDEALQPVDMHHLATPCRARDRRDGETVTRRGRFFMNDDRPLACQITLARDPLRGGHVGGMVWVGRHGAGEIAAATARRTVFAEVRAKFSGLGHHPNCSRRAAPTVRRHDRGRPGFGDRRFSKPAAASSDLLKMSRTGAAKADPFPVPIEAGS